MAPPLLTLKLRLKGSSGFSRFYLHDCNIRNSNYFTVIKDAESLCGWVIIQFSRVYTNKKWQKSDMLKYNIAKWIRFCVCVHLENNRYNLNKSIYIFLHQRYKPQSKLIN